MTSTLALPGQDRASDLDDPRCEQHWAAATFAVEQDGAPILACDVCLADVMRGAITTDCFVPVLASPINLDSYLKWSVPA